MSCSSGSPRRRPAPAHRHPPARRRHRAPHRRPGRTGARAPSLLRRELLGLLAGAGGPVVAPSIAGTSHGRYHPSLLPAAAHHRFGRALHPRGGVPRVRGLARAGGRRGRVVPACSNRSRRPSGSRPASRSASPIFANGWAATTQRNVVNRLTAGGANGWRSENPFAARRNHGPAIMKAVADAYHARERTIRSNNARCCHPVSRARQVAGHRSVSRVANVHVPLRQHQFPANSTDVGVELRVAQAPELWHPEASEPIRPPARRRNRQCRPTPGSR